MFSLSVRLQFTKVLCKEPCLVVKPFSTGYGDAVRRTISSWSCLCVYHGRPWPRKREELDVWGKRTGKLAVEPTTLGGLSQKDIVQRALAFVYSKKLTPGIVSLNSVPSQESSLPSQRVNADLYNRNPRNAELMNVAMKRTGWELEATRKDFYNKLTFERSASHTKGLVIHSSGRVVVSASTEEFAIAKHLYRNTDVSAAENIGRILAHRMLETGLVAVFSAFTDEDRKSSRIKAFLEALTEGGIQLEEPDRITTPNPFGGSDGRRLK